MWVCFDFSHTSVCFKAAFYSLHSHPLYLCCPDALNLVGDPLPANGCGSLNHI